MPMIAGRPTRGHHSVHQLYCHLVLVTQHRLERFSKSENERYFEIFNEICRDQRIRAELIALGSDKNHVHLLVRHPPTIAISTLVQFLKGRFSYVVNEGRRSNPRNTLGEAITMMPEEGWRLEGSAGAPFRWSKTYFAKTVGQASLRETSVYIKDQNKEVKPGRKNLSPTAASGTSVPAASA